jgi:hypothetical protein
MPARPIWHSRLPEIREALDRMATPVLDRAALESLFGLGRRQTIRLMSTFGGHLAGKTFLIETAALKERLDALLEKRPVSTEIARKERLADSLRAFEREGRPRSTPIAPPQPGATEVDGWPEGMALAGPGEFRIAFRTPEELLGRILALTEAAAEDYDAFVARLGA